MSARGCRVLRLLRLCCVAAVTLVIACLIGSPGIVASSSDERTLSLYNIHNGESLTVTYKKGGQFVPDAVKKLNWFCRDWRKNVPSDMDPNVFDIVWEMHEELGSQKPVYLVSGFRSPGTNEALRRAGGGQAKNSQHTHGKAMDVHFPDVPLQRMRYSALVRERGGVGYYPTSALPFVHVDTGRVRMWPRMPRQELALLFPSGHSQYVPEDGDPITPRDVEKARKNYAQLASTIAAFHQFRAGVKERTLVASLERQNAIDGATKPAQAAAPAAVAQAVSEPAPIPVQVASYVPPAPKPAIRPVLAMVPKASLASGDLTSLITGFMTRKSKPPEPQMAALGGPDLPIEATISADEPSVKRTSLQLPVPGAKKSGIGAMIASLAGSPTADQRAGKTQLASLGSESEIVPPQPEPADGTAFMSKSGWANAPEYDEDHDSELSYRPFPLEPLLTQQPSIDNPMLATLVHPDIAAAHDSIDNQGGMALRFRQGLQFAEMVWADRFSSEDVAALLAAESGGTGSAQGRKVKTASQ